MSDLIQVAGDLMPCRSCQAPFFIGGSWPPGWTVEVHREGNRTLLTPHREDCGRPTRSAGGGMLPPNRSPRPGAHRWLTATT